MRSRQAPAAPMHTPAPAIDPVASPAALLALLTDCDSVAASLLSSVPTLAALIADMHARTHESAQLASAELNSSCCALRARKTRVLGSVKRLARTQYKRIVADLEAADVSTEQLRLWAAVAGAACLDLVCTLGTSFAASPLLALPRLVQAPVLGLTTIPFIDELGSVATGDGLRVVSAAGPGLKWFEPHSRSEFGVVLAHADGSMPVWLSTGDVTLKVLSAADVTTAGTAQASRAEPGTVFCAYGGLSDDVLEAVLQLSVCGVVVVDASGNMGWVMCALRRPSGGHSCGATGTHVATLHVFSGEKLGVAASADEKWLVVGCYVCTLCVYSLPGGELVRTFGGDGDGPLQFNGLYRLCFALNDNLIVTDLSNKRLQEMTLDGVFVRFIGVGEFGDGGPFCVAVHADVIAVGCQGGLYPSPRVVLLDFGTGAVMSRFGEMGTAPGQLSEWCTGIRFTPDGSHLVIAEDEAERLSLFTAAGVFVRCVGVGVLGGGGMDVELSVTGEYVVADYYKHRVCVFSPDGSELVRSWGVNGSEEEQFECPVALATAGRHLFVMDSNRVQVYE